MVPFIILHYYLLNHCVGSDTICLWYERLFRLTSKASRRALRHKMLRGSPRGILFINGHARLIVSAQYTWWWKLVFHPTSSS